MTQRVEPPTRSQSRNRDRALELLIAMAALVAIVFLKPHHQIVQSLTFQNAGYFDALQARLERTGATGEVFALEFIQFEGSQPARRSASSRTTVPNFLWSRNSFTLSPEWWKIEPVETIRQAKLLT